MNILPIPPPVNNLTFFRRQNAASTMSSLPAFSLSSLTIDHLAILYGVGTGYSQSRDLEPIAKRHRSTIIKYLSQLQENKFLVAEVKAGTEKKRRPTLVYQLADWLPIEDIENIAYAKGINIKALVQERLTEPDSQLTPRSLSKDDLKLESQNSPLDEKESLESQPPPQDEQRIQASFEKLIFVALDRLTEEIVSLKQRMSRLEESAKGTPDFDLEAFLRRLEGDSDKNQQ